ncbi:WhiB family transcriptional regulator [Rhodococcus koreensis]
MTRQRTLHLPSPLTSVWDWQTSADCREYEVELFYDESSVSEDIAKAICGRCPVRPECREYAVTANEPHGIWGGLTLAERIQHRWKYTVGKRHGDLDRTLSA